MVVRGGFSKLFVAIVVLLGGALPAAANSCLVVDVRFTGAEPSASLLKAMRTEVSAIWATYGVRLVLASDTDASEPERVDGSLDVSIKRRAAHIVKSNQIVLGTTRLQIPSIDHSPIQIDYDAVEEVLDQLTAEQLVARTGHAGLDSTDVGRALGRVLAHEIGHVLLLAPFHQAQGLMRASYRPVDLIAIERNAFTLSKGEIARLRNREERLSTAVDQ